MRAGTIRKCDMASIYTYQNTLYKLQMTGEQLHPFHGVVCCLLQDMEAG